MSDVTLTITADEADRLDGIVSGLLNAPPLPDDTPQWQTCMLYDGAPAVRERGRRAGEWPGWKSDGPFPITVELVTYIERPCLCGIEESHYCPSNEWRRVATVTLLDGHPADQCIEPASDMAGNPVDGTMPTCHRDALPDCWHYRYSRDYEV